MAKKAGFKSVNEYLGSQSAAVRGVLQRVRSAIRKAVPEAEETIAYKLPAYTLHGRRLVYFAGWKEHYSLYPASGRTVAAFKKELAGYQVSKGTIRFELSKPVPVRLIARIAKYRAKELAGKAQAATPKKR
jgi:uncharacterized protein YdhG (YjbR/CyaY superfamily)